jgi:murein DD-endopeptidase MepM/ murein hydrolase activator NlpD
MRGARLLALVALAAGGCGGSMFHAVAAGETLDSIAAAYHVEPRALAEANAIDRPDRIAPGQLLLIPRDRRRLDEPAAVPGAQVALDRRPRTIGERPAPVDPPAEETDLAWPVEAPISSRFGMRDGRAHQGLDLAVPDGTEVRAAASGEVVYAGDQVRGYGHLVILRHPGGLETLYAHNTALLVGQGATVERGQVIALSGHSGHATAPHVHFEVREGEAARDPERYLKAR